MGYLVVGHVTNEGPNTATLAAALPSGIDWSLHEDDRFSAFYIDTFKAGRKQDWPFTSMPPTKNFPLALPAELDALQTIYRALEGAQLANSFKRSFLNMNLALSKALQIPVCSFCSDDDGLDFTCQSNSGRLVRLHCECGDLDIVYENGKATVQPLILEDGEPTDVSGLHDPQLGIHVLDRDVAQSPLLHLIASKEVAAFLGVERAPLGLGSFDGMDTPPRKIGGSPQAQPVAPSAKEKKHWWKLW